MNTTSGGELMMLAERWIREAYYPHGRPATEVPLTPDTDLIRSAILDSVGFLELLAYIEMIAGSEVCLDTADPASLTTLRSICSPAHRPRKVVDVYP